PGRVVAGECDHSRARSARPSSATRFTTRSTTSGSVLWKTPFSNARAESWARSVDVDGSGSPGSNSATSGDSEAGRRTRGELAPEADMARTVRTRRAGMHGPRITLRAHQSLAPSAPR